MAKRRTKKDKKNAKHNIKISWEPIEASDSTSKGVKGQSRNRSMESSSVIKNKKSADYTARDENTALIKKDILKSISLAGLILGLEVVIYFVL